VIAVFETGATYYTELVDCVEAVAEALVADPSASKRIRRIAMLRIDENNRALRIRSEMRRDATP
jgi:hypothetical protein